MQWILFCTCLLTIAVPLMMGAERSSRLDVAKKYIPVKNQSSTKADRTDVLTQRMQRSVFARRAGAQTQRPLDLQHAVKPKPAKRPSSPRGPKARRCPQVQGRCSPRKACRKQCPTCRCRFNTPCFCSRQGLRNHKKS